MDKKLTFKEYLASKERLREAITKIPRQTSEYSTRKYCKLVIGESKDSKEYISLKPNQTILVEWLYDNVENPTVLSIKFDNVDNVDPSDEYETFWKGKRLLNWLARNSREQN